MSIADELNKLDQLRRSGSLSYEEFETAKKRLLEGDSKPATTGDLADIKVQNEIAELDREWSLERENYMVLGKHGHRHLPNKWMSVVGGAIVVGFGCFWTAMASFITARGSEMGAPGFLSLFPLFGVVFILLGVGMSIRSFAMATKYEEAQEQYQKRRSELQGKYSAR